MGKQPAPADDIAFSLDEADEKKYPYCGKRGISDRASSKPPHPASPPSPRAATNAYIDGTTLERVQAWRSDVESKTTCRDELRSTNPIGNAAEASTKRKRDPDNEWLHQPISKRRRSDLPDRYVSPTPDACGNAFPSVGGIDTITSSEPAHHHRPSMSGADRHTLGPPRRATQSNQADEPPTADYFLRNIDIDSIDYCKSRNSDCHINKVPRQEEGRHAFVRAVENAPDMRPRANIEGSLDANSCPQGKVAKGRSPDANGFVFVDTRHSESKHPAEAIISLAPVASNRRNNGSHNARIEATSIANDRPDFEDTAGIGSLIEGPTLVASNHSNAEAEEIASVPFGEAYELPYSNISKGCAGSNPQRSVKPLVGTYEVFRPPRPVSKKNIGVTREAASRVGRTRGHGEISGNPNFGKSRSCIPTQREERGLSTEFGGAEDEHSLDTSIPPSPSPRGDLRLDVEGAALREDKLVVAQTTTGQEETVATEVERKEEQRVPDKLPDKSFHPVEISRVQDPYAEDVVDAPQYSPGQAGPSPRPPEASGRFATNSSQEVLGNTAYQRPWTYDLPALPTRIPQTFQLPSSPTSNHEVVKPPTLLPVAHPPPVFSPKNISTTSVQTQPRPPFTPTTKQSSLPTPEFTFPIKPFKDFITPSPERCRKQRRASSRDGHLSNTQTLFNATPPNPAKKQKKVSFAPLPGEGVSTPENVAGVSDVRCKQGGEREDDSLGPRGPGWSERRRAISPPLQLSQAELPAETSRFGKHFATMSRKGPQIQRHKQARLLTPSLPHQVYASPAFYTMAEPFLASGQTTARLEGELECAQQPGSLTGTKNHEEEDTDSVDDVTAVLDNLDDYLDSFDVDTELQKARRFTREDTNERPTILTSRRNTAASLAG